MDAAIQLCRSYLSYLTYAFTSPTAKRLLQQLEGEKYISQDSVLVKMPDGGTIALTVVRSATVQQTQPVVLMYNIYAGQDNATCKEAASRGYVGVVANTRGKRLSPDPIAPFENDARDAYFILDWISRQSWCNGKVGMYGGSYLGFSQWASVKKMHPALKTIVPQVAVAPGIDFPLSNGVFMHYALPWIYYVTNNKLIDTEEFCNANKWRNLNTNWYKSGASFRSLDSLAGKPSSVFQKWLQHPTYDQYWQSMTPQQKEFAAINIPVLTITGYFDADQPGALYYYKKHHQYHKNPQHYLLIGPYDHGGAQGFPKNIVSNYTIDSVANVPIQAYVFQWFDHVLKDSARPGFLKDKVNFQVMGKNEWRSAPALNKMANDTLSFYFTQVTKDSSLVLRQQRPTPLTAISQTVDFKDRSEVLVWEAEGTIGASSSLIDSVLKTEKEKMVFRSKPLDQEWVMAGSPLPSFFISSNKKDLDIVVDLYEQLPDGRYFLLSQNLQRASHAKNPSQRQLLVPHRITRVDVTNTYITCKALQKGSRLVAVVGVNKNPNWQINYGTGKDVSDETIKDAAVPLQIKWYNNSKLSLPVLRK